MLLLSIIVLTIVLIIFTAIFHKEHFVDQKSKCFSCEKDMQMRYGPDAAWMANPTKGFDDEFEAVLHAGDIRGGNLAKTIKYY